MNGFFAAAGNFFSWVSDGLDNFSLARLFSSHRTEVRYLKLQLAYERDLRKEERKYYEDDRESWEIERKRLEDRLMVRNGIPPVHAQLPQREPAEARKTTLQRAEERTKAKLAEEREKYQQWVQSAAAYKKAQEANNGNQQQEEFPPSEDT